MTKIRAVVLFVLGVAVVATLIAIAPWSRRASVSAPNTNARAPIAAAAAVAESQAAKPRIEIVSQTSTTLSMRFYDASGVSATLGFTRTTETDPWSSDSTASLGTILGNSTPGYASAARCRALGITAEQALTSLDVAICNRPCDDISIFKTYSGVAIGLWREKSIAEIWYAGTLVQDAIARARQDLGMRFVGENLKSACCNTKPNPAELSENQGKPIPAPNLDACAGIVNNLNFPDQRDAVCDCLIYACQFCVHPPPDQPVPPCSEDGLQSNSIRACILYTDNCPAPQPRSPPLPLKGWEELRPLLQEIAERLQYVFDRMPVAGATFPRSTSESGNECRKTTLVARFRERPDSRAG